jgi:hypothetical protein
MSTSATSWSLPNAKPSTAPEDIVETITTKRCGTCGDTKPVNAFYPDARHRDGYRSRCKACRALADKTWRAARLQRDPLYDRNQNLKRLYGMTLAEFDSRLAGQGGACAICAGPPRTKNTFHVDHDHKSGAIRELLCGPCNVLIGMAEEDPERLEAAAQYLRRHRV